MIQLLAEKFVKDIDMLRKLKEMIRMGAIAEMLRDDAMIEVAKNMLNDGMGVSAISKYTGLAEQTIRELQKELTAVVASA